jgi:hypothetical protein
MSLTGLLMESIFRNFSGFLWKLSPPYSLSAIPREETTPLYSVAILANYRKCRYVKFSSRKWRRNKFNFWRWLPVVAHVPTILSDCTSLRQWLNYGGRNRVDRKAVWSPSQMVGGYWRWKHRKTSHPKTASMKLSLSIFLRSGYAAYLVSSLAVD